MEAREKLKSLRADKAFKEAEQRNSISAYREFIRAYPDSVHIEEAKKISGESDEEALGRTFNIGTLQAFQGFTESYPGSKYFDLIKARIEFLKATEAGTINSYQQFISQYPHSPFVHEAKASFPVLWLKELNGKVGVVIIIDNFISWRGLLAGGKINEEEVRQKIFNELKKTLEESGIKPLLLKSMDDLQGADILLTINYSEKEQRYKGSDGPPPRQYGYVTDTLNQAAADNLATVLGGVFHRTIQELPVYTISDARNDFTYYLKIPSLINKAPETEIIKALTLFGDRSLQSLTIALYNDDSDVRQYAVYVLGETRDDRAVELLIGALKDYSSNVRKNSAEALGKMGDARAVEPLIAALNDMKWEVCWEAAKALRNLTGKDFGEKVHEHKSIVTDALMNGDGVRISGTVVSVSNDSGVQGDNRTWKSIEVIQKSGETISPKFNSYVKIYRNNQPIYDGPNMRKSVMEQIQDLERIVAANLKSGVKVDFLLRNGDGWGNNYVPLINISD